MVVFEDRDYINIKAPHFVFYIEEYLERKYPKELALEYDKIGLQVGNSNVLVKNILTTLDVTEDEFVELLEEGCETGVLMRTTIQRLHDLFAKHAGGE